MKIKSQPKRPYEMSEELDKYHYHEFIDRTDCVRRMIDQLLEEHPVAMAHPELAAYLNSAQVLLGNAYQAAGVIENEEFWSWK